MQAPKGNKSFYLKLYIQSVVVLNCTCKGIQNELVHVIQILTVMKRCINFQIWINFKVSHRLGLIEFNSLIKVHVFLALNMNILNNKEIVLAYVFKSNWQISHQFLCESLQLLNHSVYCPVLPLTVFQCALRHL